MRLIEAAGSIIVSIAVLACATAFAGGVRLVGATQGKATLMIGGGPPRTLKVGDRTEEGIKLLSADAHGAELSWDGKRHRLPIGGTGIVGSAAPVSATAPADEGGGSRITLQADAAGHFWAMVTINGLPVRGMIDTGASGVALSSVHARTMGIDYLQGTRSMANTAGGYVPMYRVTLNEVRLGDIVLYQVPAAVLEGPFPDTPLLGNTLLNRLNMDRKGDQLTLTKRF